jgi:hypothetical protein
MMTTRTTAAAAATPTPPTAFQLYQGNATTVLKDSVATEAWTWYFARHHTGNCGEVLRSWLVK